MGCTLNGGAQPVSSFGDARLYNGEVMPVDTFYEVLLGDAEHAEGDATGTNSNVVVEVIGSDGFFDVLTHSEIAEAVVQGKRKATITLTSDHADGHVCHAATLDDEVGHAMRANEVVVSSTASSLAGCILDALWEKMMAVHDC